MKQLLMQKKGMTMVELLLSLAILAIVVLPFSGMFLNSSRIENISSDYMKATQLAQELMEEHKNNSYSIINASLVNAEGTSAPNAMAITDEGNLRADVYYWDYRLLNEYDASSAGLPDSFDITANLEEEKAGYSGENKVYYYYDNGSKTFGLAAHSYDVIDKDTTSSDKNIKQLHLEKVNDSEVRISISKSDGSVLSALVGLKPAEDAYNFKIECFGKQDGSDITYRIINESGCTVNVYRIDHLSFDSSSGNAEIIRNKVDISNLKGKVAIKSNTPGQDFISGKHYKILVEVKDKKNSNTLAKLYGISR